MADLAELTRCGKELGLGGAELRIFVEEGRTRAEEERTRAERDERERHEREREKRAHERDLKRLELEILEKQAEVKAVNNDQQRTSDVRKVTRPEFRPKLPSFDENKDELDSYIERFERYADAQEWKPEDRSVYLGTLLTGKALDVYVRMSPEEANDYAQLKQALFKRFRLTEEGFRKKFFSTKPESGETAAQFAFRLGTYLDMWIELSDIGKDYESLRQLFLKEQFIMNTPRDLSVFIRERAPETITCTVRLAETFMEARNWTHLNRPGNANQILRTNQTQKRDAAAYDNKSAHIGKSTQQIQGEVTCYRCRETGHIARQCKNVKRMGDSYGKKSTYTAFCKVETPTCQTHSCSLRDGTATLECGCNIPVLSSSCQDSAVDLTGLHIGDGYVGGKKVRVMRDTGCSGVVVQRSLVEDCQLVGVEKKYVMIDRTVRMAPIARIFVQTPFFTGEVEALCMANPICELIIGNVPGALISTENETEIVDNTSSDKPPFVDDVFVEADAVETEVTNAVQMRSQTVKGIGNNLLRPLNVPLIEIPSLTREIVVEKQREDETLKRFHLRGERGDSPKPDRSGYRIFRVQKWHIVSDVCQISRHV